MQQRAEIFSGSMTQLEGINDSDEQRRFPFIILSGKWWEISSASP
jgi:hypothetical protein